MMQQSTTTILTTPRKNLTSITGKSNNIVTPQVQLAPLTEVILAGRDYYRVPRHPLDPNSREYLYQDRLKVDLITRFLNNGKPIVLLGQPGSGKTELARALSHYMTPEVDEVYQMEFSNIISGDMVDGMWQLLNGNTSHLPSEHLKAVRSASEGQRVFYILDEMNRAAPGGLNSLLRLYAQWEYISSTNEVFNVEPRNLISVATLNIGHRFSGTNSMDAALLDRFSAIELEDPRPEIINLVLQERFGVEGLKDQDREALVKIYSGSRNVKAGAGYVVTMRDVQTLAASMTIGGLDLLDSIHILIGGAVKLRGLPKEQAESLITLAKTLTGK